MTGGAEGGGGGGRPSGASPGVVSHVQRVLPTTRAILWNPLLAGGDRPPSGAYPLFLEQKVIGALHEHFVAASTQAILGFLVGDLYVCPTTQVRYAVVDSTIRLNQAIYGDKTLVVVSRLWERIQEELRRIRGELIGWYHSHQAVAVELAPGDVETHQQYFQRRWQAALVLGADRDGPAAGIFRPGPSPTWSSVSLPFYELIDGDERLAGGRKRSVLPWTNFATDDPAMTREEASAPRAPEHPRSTIEVVGGQQKAAPAPPPTTPAPKPKAPPAPSPPPRKSAPVAPPVRDLPLLDTSPAAEPPPPRRPAEPVFKPAATKPEPPEPLVPLVPLVPLAPLAPHAPLAPSRSVVTPRRPSPRPTRSVGTLSAKERVPTPRPSRRGRGWLVALLLLLVSAGGAGWYFYYGPGVALRARLLSDLGVGGGVPAVTGRRSNVMLMGFARVSDSLAEAVRHYRDRAKLFDNRQIECRALAPGLVTVEDRLSAYSSFKAKVPMIDSAVLVRDQALTAGADSVERHFDRSGCPRP